MPLVDAGLLRDMPTDRGRLVRAHGYAVAVFVVNGELRAVDDRCLHTGGPLADGWVVDGCVVCPWHGWVYDLATGERVVGARTTGPLRTYPVAVDEDGRVKVEIPDEVGG
ncbi:MAG TPA: Rieske 2Fe-2S domain-containing protein [Acidimicrobiales bacterium]|nr:Rieske 2Fe-2S domain-containing protein [Acidimicrobiales bacterium]